MFSHLKTANVFQIFVPFDLCFATLCSRILINLSVLSFMYSLFNSFFFLHLIRFRMYYVPTTVLGAGGTKGEWTRTSPALKEGTVHWHTKYWW